MPPRVAKPTKSAEPAAVAPTPSAKPAKASAMAPAKAAAKTATPPASAKGAKGKAVAVAEPVQPKAAASAPVAVTPITPATGGGGDSTPRRKSRNVDDEDKTTSELIKEFGKAIRKRIGAGNFADVDGKDVRSVVRLLNQIRKDATPKPKGDRAPMNAFFYYQALRHLQVKKNGGPSAKEAERIKQLTDAQPEDKPLIPADPKAAYPGEVRVTGKAGSVAVINGHIWHGGTRNESGASRQVLHLAIGRRDIPQQLVEREHLTDALWARSGAAERFLLDIEGAAPKVHGYPPLPDHARVWTAADMVDAKH